MNFIACRVYDFPGLREKLSMDLTFFMDGNVQYGLLFQGAIADIVRMFTPDCHEGHVCRVWC